MNRILGALATLALALGLVASATASANTAPPAAPTQPQPRPASVNAAPVATTPWVDGRGPAGGNMNGIAVSPAYNIDHTAYAFNSFSGVYRSLDSGITWTSINVGLSDKTLDVRALAISPYFGAGISGTQSGDNTLFSGTA